MGGRLVDVLRGAEQLHTVAPGPNSAPGADSNDLRHLCMASGPIWLNHGLNTACNALIAHKTAMEEPPKRRFINEDVHGSAVRKSSSTVNG